MNFGDFKKYVAAYINRDTNTFVVNGIDVLAQAVNVAKRSAQMKYNFNQLRGVGWIKTNAYGAQLSTITSDMQGLVPLSVKRIDAVWQYDDLSPAPQRIRQINMIQNTELKNILPTLLNYMTEPRTLPVTLKNRAYVYGTKFFITGFMEMSTFWLDVITWLPDYVEDTDSDIFITQYQDWMLFRILIQLNAFIKETERIQVSKAMLDAAWEEVTMHDSELMGANDTAASLE